MNDLPVILKVGEREYMVDYENALKTTSSVRIRNGRVVLKLSRFVRGRKRDEMIEKFLAWAGDKLAQVSKTDFILPEYEDGGRIYTHNKVYDLRVIFENRAGSRSKLYDSGVIEIRMPLVERSRARLKFLVEKVIIEDQSSYLREVLDELNQLYFQEDFNECRFKRVSSRFGSCSVKRNINIAFRLLFAPREVFRYVCIHELSHLREFNHSRRFWALVEGAMPDYKVQERWLKDCGFALG